MPSCLTTAVFDQAFPLPGAVPAPRVELTERDRESLLEALGRVPDPRTARGVRYPIVAMLSVVVCAMLAGARSYAAIGEWCADLDAATRRTLGFTGRAPGTVTIWRLLIHIDAPALDAVVCVWIRAYLERVNAAARCAGSWPWTAKRCARPCAGRTPCTCSLLWITQPGWSSPRYL